MSRRGVTFLEVLFASAILLAALVALSSGLRLATRAAARAEVRLEVEALARQLLGDLERQGAAGLTAKDGDFGPAHPGVTYRLEVTPTELPTLRTIEVTLKWSESGQPRALTLTGAVGP